MRDSFLALLGCAEEIRDDPNASRRSVGPIGGKQSQLTEEFNGRHLRMLKCEDRTALEAVIEESDSSYIYDIPSEDRKPREDLLKVVFGPPTSPEPFTQRSQSRSVTAASSTSPSPSPSPSPSRSRTGSPATSRFYCQPCKKGFGSKSTWDSHCKSSKHLSNVASPTKKASSTRNVNPAMRQGRSSMFVIYSIDLQLSRVLARPGGSQHQGRTLLSQSFGIFRKVGFVG